MMTRVSRCCVYQDGVLCLAYKHTSAALKHVALVQNAPFDVLKLKKYNAKTVEVLVEPLHVLLHWKQTIYCSEGSLALPARPYWSTEEGRGLASEDGKLQRRRMLQCAAERISLVFGLNFVFREQHNDEGLIRTELLSVEEILKLMLGQLHEKHAMQRKIWLPVQNFCTYSAF